MRTTMRSRVASCTENASLPAGSCVFFDLSNATNVADPTALSIALYGLAKFCIHPTGDTPMRRAFYDSILMGCIPVTITPNRNGSGGCNAPWHYANDVAVPFAETLKDVTMVESEFESGAFIDRLLAMPASKLDAIQATLLTHAHALQYREPLASTSHAESFLQGSMDAADYIFESIAEGRAFKRRV